jgi:hypothetical protein
MSHTFRCETCQELATVHIGVIGVHFCASCLEKIDQRIKEINEAADKGHINMVFNIPNFMAGTSQPVTLTLNLDITPERYSEVCDIMIAWANVRSAVKGTEPALAWDKLASAVADLILFDGNKLTGEEFGKLIHGEWRTLVEFCKYCSQVLYRIGQIAEKTPTP